ncbi:MAG: hypothetical protein JWM21_73 [Acidobacteria bacterium]|nr:hypothetical protein [Acidobacteriota bacterium]
MRRHFLLVSLVILYLSTSAVGKSQRYPCLTSGIKATDIVTAKMTGSGPKGAIVERVTVAQELSRLKARCQRGKLVDNAGKAIRFYRLSLAPGCFGMQPPDYEQRLAKQEKEIALLEKRYRVIQMTCNPAGIPRP